MRKLLPAVFVTVLPVILAHDLWFSVWQGGRSLAWDGTGHFAIASLYSRFIFPDTFGWITYYFAGIPFPNFYPPVYYWSIALLEHAHLLSFASSFKLVTSLPILLMPLSMWALGLRISNGDRLTAFVIATASVFLLVDLRCAPSYPSGLDYFSTFQIGLYTQPLGFVLLLAWFCVYSKAQSFGRNFLLAVILLTLTVLSNFFSATTAAIFITLTCISDFLRYRFEKEKDVKRQSLNTLLRHLTGPLLAGLLAMFWLVPMLNESKYFVTRPSILDIKPLLTPVLLAWYFLAILGTISWLRRPTPIAASYLGSCVVLAALVFTPSIFALTWFPLQTARFFSMLNFLLAGPVGIALVKGFRLLAWAIRENHDKSGELSLAGTPYTVGLGVGLLLLATLTMPPPRSTYAFYSTGNDEKIEDILQFARKHSDGRYLVSIFSPEKTLIGFDARAINSYLGMQGNETLCAVFHEVSPLGIFSLPLVNAFSTDTDTFGVSSMLGDDLDFAAQPLEAQLARARFLGVRYLIVRDPDMKQRITASNEIRARYDFGWWSIFELNGQIAPPAQVLEFKPALVVSSFTVKQRRQTESSYIRWVEEQFADSWFDVRLVRSPETKLDRLEQLENFGALVIDTYEYSDEDRAFQTLRDYAQRHRLILLSSPCGLFRRLEALHAEIPTVVIVDRPLEVEPGAMLDATRPQHHYQSSSIRQQWTRIRQALEDGREPVQGFNTAITIIPGNNSMEVRFSTPQAKPMPVLLSRSFHPNWQRQDGGAVYTTTPFYMLSFIDHSTGFVYRRSTLERFSIWISTATLLMLSFYGALIIVRNARRRASESGRNGADRNFGKTQT